MHPWADSGLLLVGHGSSRLPTSRLATDRLADDIRRLNLFADVTACFWKEAPVVSLDLTAAKTVYVVPNFAGEGVFTRQLIPQKLGITGPLTTIGGRQVVYTGAVGSHPRVPSLLLSRVENLCAAEDIPPASVALLIVGHGSRQPGITSATPEAVATEIRASNRFAEVVTAYIEQAPHVADWQRLVSAQRVIVAPLLISQGMHAGEELPPLFGLSEPCGGPAQMAGRTCWLMGGIADHGEVVELILDQIRRTEAAHSPDPRCQ